MNPGRRPDAPAAPPAAGLALLPNPPPDPLPDQLPDHLLYARWLARGGRLGLWVLVLSFAAYAFGLAAPQVPLARLPALWSLPADAFAAQAGMPAGWGWLAVLDKPDVAGIAGIALLAGCALPGLLALVRLYWQRGERLLAAVCLAQAALLLLAASGLLSGGQR